jgi:DNA polymerase-3 subunit gamma/tau
MLYNEYRPKTFEDVVGQENNIEIIKAAMAKNKLAQSILISGIHGTGKTTLARIIARETGCSEVDIIEIDAASNNSVDDVRRLITMARIPPHESKFKTYVIDEAHMYSNAAFNALLKILEEPPKHCRFILCTTEKHKIIATILSRCQKFDLRIIEDSDIVGRLRYICESEEIEYEDDALCFIAREAQGSLRDAISLLELCRNKCVMDEITDKLNVVGTASYLELMDTIVSAEVDKMLIVLNEIGKKIDAVKLCEGLSSFIRDLFYFKSADTDVLITMSELQKDAMRKLYQDLGAAFIFNMMNMLNGCAEAHSTLAVRLNLELALIKLILQRKKSKN